MNILLCASAGSDVTGKPEWQYAGVCVALFYYYLNLKAQKII